MLIIKSINYLFNVLSSILNGKILSLSLFCTNRCNSKCKTCHIWKIMPKVDISIKAIEEILTDKSITNSTIFSLTGGEFLLHPKYKEILALFKKHKRKYVLLTNGILADKVIETVKEFNIKKIAISLDGPRDTYKKIRGVDNYDNIMKIISELKTSTNIHLHYTISPWNNSRDLEYISDFCQKNDIGLSLDVYQEIKYFKVGKKRVDIKSYNQLLHNGPKKILRNTNFIKMYVLWFDKKLRLPCWSIKLSTNIMPNGDVFLCQYKDVVLGNINRDKLNQIWDSEKTKKIQSKSVRCNSCWLGCQRGFDCNMCWIVNKIIPQNMLKSIFGFYDFKKALRC